MLPFEYERFEQIEDGVCIYHNVVMLKSIGITRKGNFFTRIEYCVDTAILSFYTFDKVEHTVHFVPEYVELEMA